MLHGCLETPSLPIAPVTNGKPLTPQCASCLFIDAYVRRPQTASWTWGSADWHTTDWHGTVPHHDIQFSSIKCLCNQRNGVVVLFNHTPSNGPPLRFSSLKLYNRLLAVYIFNMGVPDPPFIVSMNNQKTVTNSHGTTQAEPHPQTTRPSGRPVATTSTAPTTRSTCGGLPDTSGPFPGALGRILGRSE